MKLLPSHIVCQQAVDLMSDYLEGSLTRRQRRRLEGHLAGCDACQSYLEQLRITIAASGVATVSDVEPETLEALVDLYRKFHDQS
jgi:anti-sigma factor RsiW